MAIEYRKTTAILRGEVGVEDAEGLLEWLQGKPGAKVNLAACTHLHAANLQVLMAAHPAVSVWPEDAGLAGWLQSALSVPPARRND